ncbi:MAG: hypothetical protein ABIG87_00765 [Patescibacteria group bacterium]
MNFKNNKGFIKWLFLILLAVIALGYFGFDLRTIIESEPVQDNLSYLWGIGVTVWNEYLSQPVLYFWHNIFIDLLWETFVENMERLKAGQATTAEQLAPEIMR